METLIPEKQFEQVQRIPASEVFTSGEELMDSARRAIEEGVVTTKLAEHGETPDLMVGIEVRPEEIEPGSMTPSEMKIKYGPYDDFEFTEPEKILDVTAKTANEKILNRICLDNNWHLEEPKLEQDLKEGIVSEQFRIKSDSGEEIPLINFTETTLTEDQLSRIKDAASKVSAASGGALFRSVGAICIQKTERFKDKVVGSARGTSGVILLSERLITGELDGNEDRPEAYDKVTNLESTLTHEMAHLIEIQDEVYQAYGKATGWRESNKAIVDDYGNTVGIYRNKLETPLMVQVADENGKLEDVYAPQKYGMKTVEGAKPASRYGNTNRREDFAETFVPYIHADRFEKPGIIDPLRRDAIDGMMRRVASAEHGPKLVSIDKIPVSTRIGETIEPREYVVAEPTYSVASASVTQQIRGSQPYVEKQNTFVDDFGNEQTKGSLQPSQ